MPTNVDKQKSNAWKVERNISRRARLC